MNLVSRGEVTPRSYQYPANQRIDRVHAAHAAAPPSGAFCAQHRNRAALHFDLSAHLDNPS